MEENSEAINRNEDKRPITAPEAIITNPRHFDNHSTGMQITNLGSVGSSLQSGKIESHKARDTSPTGDDGKNLMI